MPNIISNLIPPLAGQHLRGSVSCPFAIISFRNFPRFNLPTPSRLPASPELLGEKGNRDELRKPKQRLQSPPPLSFSFSRRVVAPAIFHGVIARGRSNF